MQMLQRDIPLHVGKESLTVCLKLQRLTVSRLAQDAPSSGRG
jgi:hypothetical protein